MQPPRPTHCVSLHEKQSSIQSHSQALTRLSTRGLGAKRVQRSAQRATLHPRSRAEELTGDEAATNQKKRAG